MPTRNLPLRPSLDQLKRQAHELKSAHAAGNAGAAARIAGHHPGWKGRSSAAVLAGSLKLADAQLVIAREYGFPNWAGLEHHVEIADHVARYRPHPHFDEALAALDAGNIGRLRELLAAYPDLVHARTSLEPPYHYFTAATLLHHVANNPGRDVKVPRNIVAIARLLLESGADVRARTLGPNGGTTMGLVATSHGASAAGVSGPLIDLLLEFGDTIDLDDPGVLRGSLANHAPRAAERLIELGARPDVLAAAALGRMDLLRSMFDEQNRLLTRPHLHGTVMNERDAVGLALLYAYVNRHVDAVEYLIEKNANLDMTGVNNGTLLHRAAWAGDLPMVRRLVAKGADIGNRDNPFVSTPLSWAQHNRQFEMMEWMRANCAIDLHDAVCLNLGEHVEARIAEDASSVNRRIDQWDMPASTPLHWAAWPQYSDVDGTHGFDPAERLDLVRYLLDRGGDPNIVAGNGCTALDVAKAGGNREIESLIEERGGRTAAELEPG